MIRFLKLTPICFLITATAGLAQVAPMAPLAPMPAMAPMAPMPQAAPAPRAAPSPFAVEAWADQMDQMREQASAVREQSSLARELAAEVRDQVRTITRNGLNFDLQLDVPFAMAQVAQGVGRGARGGIDSVGIGRGNVLRGNVNGLYNRGLSALDSHRYDQALDSFNEVVARGGAQADGALYWKAYTLNKLGRRDEAVAAIAELRKSFATSRWLDDAKALELEVKQAAGQKVSPENEPDDELKLMALNGLVQSDPDRAFPLLENLLKGPQSPRLKQRAIYVLAQNSTPRAQQLLEKIARGGGNPDLQLTAIQYLGQRTNQANRGQVLLEIYNATTDTSVKMAVIDALSGSRDKDSLLQLARGEKSMDLRLNAIQRLSSSAAQAEIWQLYQTENAPEVKRQILDSISSAGNTEKLIEIARTEKDATLRRTAIQRLGNVKAANTSDALVSIYGTEADAQVKRSIISALANQHNVKALIDIGHKETNVELQKEIVRQVVNMHSPESAAFLEEILKK